jgi:hypothetical protein
MARLALVAALLALLAACGGKNEDGAAPDAGPVDVELVVVTGVDTSERFEVRCDPAGGTTPDPEETCEAIAEHPEMLSVPELTATCAGSLGIPPEVRIGGTAAGKPVEVAVRECDEPAVRAEVARLWLEAAGLSSG